MFYDVLGRLISRAAITLESDITPAVEDEALRRQVVAIAQLLDEIGKMWTQIPAALEREVASFGALFPEVSGTDPVSTYRTLLTRVDEELRVLMAGDLDESQKRIAELRAAMAESAEIEHELVSVARVPISRGIAPN